MRYNKIKNKKNKSNNLLQNKKKNSFLIYQINIVILKIF